MASPQARRVRGRPRHGRHVKCAPLNVRTSPELRQRIEAALAESGRSLAQEVECRLHLTFDLEADERLRAIAKAALASSGGNTSEEGTGDGDGGEKNLG